LSRTELSLEPAGQEPAGLETGLREVQRRQTGPVKARKVIFRLLCPRYCQTMGAWNSATIQQDAAWRLTCGTLPPLPKLDAVTTNNKPKPQIHEALGLVCLNPN